MAKFVSSGFLDALFNAVDGSTVMHICSGQPANFAGIAAVSLGSVAIDSGDFSLSGAAPARVLTVAAQAVPVTADGTMTHVVITDGTDILATTVSSTAITDGATVNVGSFDVTTGVS